MTTRSLRILLCISLLPPVCTVQAQDSGNVIPFQGQLANQAGQPLNPTNAVTLVFRMCQVAVGGVAIWEESQPDISVNMGRFSALLGSRTPLPAPTYFNNTLYLGITVDDGNPATADVELRPRQALVPVVSASYARNSGSLGGYGWSALFGTNNPVDGALLPSKIGSNSITRAQIAPLTITAAQIASQTITAGQLASSTITSNQIVAGTIDISLLAQRVAESLSPAGSITAFGGGTNQIPAGWLLCDGRPVSSGQYPRLFAAISTNWGSGIPTSTNDFNLPDLRGLFLRGVNGTRTNVFNTSQPLMDPDAGTRTNLLGGAQGNSVGSMEADQFGAHQHRPFTSSSSVSPVPVQASGITGALFNPTAGDSAPNTGPAGGSETRPKNAYVNYIIKY